jgi:hypothetical protein
MKVRFLSMILILPRKRSLLFMNGLYKEKSKQYFWERTVGVWER